VSTRDIVAVLSFLLLLAIVALAIWAIRRRSAKQSFLGALTEIDSLTGTLVATAAGKYVSTVFTERPLDRVLALGLMHRGNAILRVFTDGVHLEREGEKSFAISAANIVGVERASASLDRGVERRGLLRLTWMLSETSVTTNLRIDAADDSQHLFDSLTKFKNKEEIR
jgi:hypothetical protein